MHAVSEKDFERTLKALANRRRVAILRHLKKHKRASVGDIAREIKLSFNATSKHLSVLYAADILDRTQVGLLMFYANAPATPPAARLIISIL